MTLRDFRDPADVDDALDAIRVGSRDVSRELYIRCLETAYQQGRRDMLQELIDGDVGKGRIG